MRNYFSPASVFSGIVQSVGVVLSVKKNKGGKTCDIRTSLRRNYRPGESILLSGICTTVVAAKNDVVRFFFMEETLEKTTAKSWTKGTRVNIEPALMVGQDLSGHMVTGHVDGMGIVKTIRKTGRTIRVAVSVPAALSRYVVSKGSIAIDGVSLTVVDTARSQFSVALIPFTRGHTTFSALKEKDSVNVEVDVLAKYVERLMKQSNP